MSSGGLPLTTHNRAWGSVCCSSETADCAKPSRLVACPTSCGNRINTSVGESPSRARASSRLCGWNKRGRSEEHTSELQSRLHLVCRLLLEKKKENTADVCHS